MLFLKDRCVYYHIHIPPRIFVIHTPCVIAFVTLSTPLSPEEDVSDAEAAQMHAHTHTYTCFLKEKIQVNFPTIFKKRQRNQRSNTQHLLDHGKSERVPEKHLFLLY